MEHLNGLVKFAVASIVGLGFGVYSAQSMIDGYGGLFSKQNGPWTSWPTAGTRSSNPYVRAHYLTHDRLPISQFEINEMEAQVDSDGDQLDGNCTYEIRGTMPKARWWSLYTFSKHTSDLARRPKRAGLASQQIFYQPDGSFRIRISNEPQTGNWLVPASDGDFVIVLRHYNPARSISSQYNVKNLPTIKRGECR